MDTKIPQVRMERRGGMYGLGTASDWTVTRGRREKARECTYCLLI